MDSELMTFNGEAGVPARRVLIVAPGDAGLPDPPRFHGVRSLEILRVGSLRETPPEDTDWNVLVYFQAEPPAASTAENLACMRAAAPEGTLLVVTASPDIREAVEYLKGGVYEYLPLPLDSDSYAQAVSEALGNNEAYREIVELNRLLVEEKEELAVRNRELIAISDVARAVSHSLELDDVLDRLVECIENTFSFDRVTVGLSDPVQRREVARISRGVNALSTSGEAWDVSEGGGDAWVDTIYGGGMVLNLPRRGASPETLESPIVRLHGLPLAKIPMVARGNVVGAITVDNHRNGHPILDQEIGVLKIFADTAAISVENSRLYQMVRELSLRDELTGLYNRRFLIERTEAELTNAQRRELPLSVIMLDLDHFKVMNDANDHQTGDAALKKVARILVNFTRGVDIAARYGGEEMMVILPSTGLDDAIKVAEKLRLAVETAEFLGEALLPGGRLTVSLGVAAYPRHGETLHDLFERADHALYEAKRQGRNRVGVAR